MFIIHLTSYISVTLSYLKHWKTMFRINIAGNLFLCGCWKILFAVVPPSNKAKWLKLVFLVKTNALHTKSKQNRPKMLVTGLLLVDGVQCKLEHVYQSNSIAKVLRTKVQNDELASGNTWASLEIPLCMYPKVYAFLSSQSESNTIKWNGI